jgi:hypothetical protein
MASFNYLDSVVNFAANIQSVAGNEALKRLSVVALDSSLKDHLPSDCQLIPYHLLAREIGFCDRGSGNCDIKTDPKNSDREINYDLLWSFRVQVLTVLLEKVSRSYTS